jgi:hypothetical protein
MTGTPKVCIRCKQDCSNRPRTKDPQGNYTCKECFDQLAAASKVAPNKAAAKPAPRAATPVAAAADIYDDEAGFMASLLDDNSSAQNMQTGAVACPNCGGGMATGAMVCITCGYNKATGQAATASVVAGPGDGGRIGGDLVGSAGALAKVAAGAMASGSMILVGSIVGAAIGGGIGAAIWAAICYNINYEIGWIAWGVGILAGFGAAIGSRGHTGLLTGGIAVVVAILAILAGKYITIDMTVNDIAKQVAREMEVTEDNAIAVIARGIAAEHENAGRTVNWPQDINPDYAFEEDEFPEAIWKDAKGRWARLPETSRADYRDAAHRDQQRFIADVAEYAKGEGFIHMFSLFDILFFGLAIVSAAGIGAGGSMSED